MPVQLNSFLPLLTRSSRISGVTFPLVLLVIIHFLNCHLYFIVHKREKGSVFQLEVWVYSNFVWALQWVSRDNSVLSVSTGAQLLSLPSSSYAGMHSLTGVDMMAKVKHKKKKHKSERLLCLQWWAFESQHLILFCAFQTETTRALKTLVELRTSCTYNQPYGNLHACAHCNLSVSCSLQKLVLIFWKTSLDPSSTILSLWLFN